MKAAGWQSMVTHKFSTDLWFAQAAFGKLNLQLNGSIILDVHCAFPFMNSFRVESSANPLPHHDNPRFAWRKIREGETAVLTCSDGPGIKRHGRQTQRRTWSITR